jgi:hypothetical protein
LLSINIYTVSFEITEGEITMLGRQPDGTQEAIEKILTAGQFLGGKLLEEKDSTILETFKSTVRAKFQLLNMIDRNLSIEIAKKATIFSEEMSRFFVELQASLIEQVEEQKAEAKPKSEAESKPEAEFKPEAEAKAELKAESRAEAKAELKAEPEAEAKAELKAEPEAKAELKAEPRAEAKAELKAEPEAEAKAELKAEPRAEAKAELKAEPEAEAKTELGVAESKKTIIKYVNVSVPSDDHCLFWSLALGLLLPRLNNENAFYEMYARLFGTENFILDTGEEIEVKKITESVRNILLCYDPTTSDIPSENNILAKLICKVFRNRVVDEMEKLSADEKLIISAAEQKPWESYVNWMRSNGWGGNAEIDIISKMTLVSIQLNSKLYVTKIGEAKDETRILHLIDAEGHYKFKLEKTIYDEHVKELHKQKEPLSPNIWANMFRGIQPLQQREQMVLGSQLRNGYY